MHIKKAINSFNNFLESRKRRDQSTNGTTQKVLVCIYLYTFPSRENNIKNSLFIPSKSVLKYI